MMPSFRMPVGTLKWVAVALPLWLVGAGVAYGADAAANQSSGNHASQRQSPSASTSQPDASGDATLETEVLENEPLERKRLLQRARELEWQQQIERQRQQDQQSEAVKRSIQRAIQSPDIQSVQPDSEPTH